jgi:hypothetical protein
MPHLWWKSNFTLFALLSRKVEIMLGFRVNPLDYSFKERVVQSLVDFVVAFEVFLEAASLQYIRVDFWR